MAKQKNADTNAPDEEEKNEVTAENETPEAEGSAEAVETPEKKKTGIKFPLLEKKQITVIIVLICAAAVLALLGIGYSIWQSVRMPKAPLDINNPDVGVIGALYSEKSKKKPEMSPRLNAILGLPAEEKLVSNGSASREVAPPAVPGTEQSQASGNPQFAEREWILTDKETYDKLHSDPAMQRDLQVKALIKLALVENCERVQYSVEYIDLPQEGGIDTIEKFLAAHEGEESVKGEGGYTMEYSAEWANLILSRNIKGLANDRATFEGFVKELETYVPQPVLVVPGAGR